MEARVVTGPEIQRIAERLRQVDKKLPARLRKELRKAAQPAVQAAKREARSLPSRGVKGGTSRHPHRRNQLRRKLARGVRVQASTGGRRGAGLRIVTAMPTASEALLPRGFDSPEGFRHPVFGNRDVWVRQDGASWFRQPIGRQSHEVRARVARVIDETAQWIAQAGGR